MYNITTEKEIERTIKFMKKYAKEVLSSKEKARDFLVKTGCYRYTDTGDIELIDELK